MAKLALVLEDEDAIRTMVSQLLIDNGYWVRSYASPADVAGEHAGGAPAENEPLVIISDLQMPRVSGLEFVRNQRLCKSMRGYIALMSGCWGQDDLAEAEALGCKIFHKPFKISDLNDWIQSLPLEQGLNVC